MASKSALADFGIHAIVGLQGTELGSREAELLRALQPAGIILFAKNVDKTTQDWRPRLHRLIADARDCVAREHFFVSIDHEGGRVHRFPEPVTRFPAALSWQDAAASVARAMAKELRALGCTLSFAPVLDTWSEEQNTVIGDRAFARTPSEVAQYAVSFARALEAEGVLACGKHFPGHGATLSDSHFELPYLECSAQELAARELIPFRTYIEAGFPLIMTSHVVYSGIDSLYPATLSAEIVSGLLRSTLAFDACVITDDLEMRALEQFSREEIAVRALTAGVDLLLEGNPKEDAAVERLEQMLRGLAQAVDDERLAPEALQHSRQRIEQLFRYHDDLRARAPEVDSGCVGCEAHAQLNQNLRNTVQTES